MEERQALIELLDRDGSVRARHPVARWPVDLGRALDCDVVLDDPHVAAHHARLAPDGEGRLAVTALASMNGVVVGRRRLGAGESAEVPGDGVLRLGQTYLRLRRPGEALAPERPLAARARRALAVDAALVAAVVLVAGGVEWLDRDRGSRLSSIASDLLAGGVLLLAWSGAWGLAAKLFLHRFSFRPHLRLALGFLLAWTGVDFLMHGLAFSLSWSLPSRLAGWAQAACALALVRLHLGLVLPQHRRALSRSAVALFAAAMAISMAYTWQQSDRVLEELYSATLGPPALRLRRPVPPATLLDEVRGLREGLDRHAQEEGGGPPDE